MQSKTSPSAPGAAYANSPEDVSTIVIDARFLQDREHLVLKTSGCVMTRLTLDVPHHCTFMGRADTKGRVPFLPGKASVLPVQPSGCIAFHVLNRFCQGHSSRKCNQQMNMIAGSARKNQGDVFFSRHTTEVSACAGSGMESTRSFVLKMRCTRLDVRECGMAIIYRFRIWDSVTFGTKACVVPGGLRLKPSLSQR